jgi:hypothetical protein
MFIFNQSFNSQYKKLKCNLNYLIIIIGIIILISSCTHISSSPSQNTGGIYGKIELNRKEKFFDNVKVRVEGTGLTTKVDTSGIFYIPEVPVGEYTLVASAFGFLDGVLENVFVAKDSISIVAIGLKDISHYTFSEKNTWEGIKISKTNIKSKGKIKGHVKNINNASPIYAMVCIENTFWVAYTDSLGEYQLTDILPGKYTIKAFQSTGRKARIVGHELNDSIIIAKLNFDLNQIMSGGYRPMTVKNVRVAPDSTSIIDIQLQSTWISEEYPPVQRKEIIIKDSQ